MSKTNAGLVQYGRSKIGTPYVYGTKMEFLTQVKFIWLQNTYGKSYVWDSDANKIGKVCCDCSGLISSYTGITRNSAGYKNAAKEIHAISTIASAPVGALVWMTGHIGVYTGMVNGIPYYVAEDGSAYGCREVPLSNNKFTHWFLCSDIEYLKEEEEMTQEKFNEMMEAYNKDVREKSVSDWAKKYWDNAIAQGILDGTMPQAPVTREQLATVLVNAGLI